MSNEPRVSVEDRDAAIKVVALALAERNDLQVSRRRVQHAKVVIADLVSHGWGPKPTVSRREIERHIYWAALAAGSDLASTKVFDAIVSAAVGAVMVAGIEVTDGTA